MSRTPRRASVALAFVVMAAALVGLSTASQAAVPRDVVVSGKVLNPQGFPLGGMQVALSSPQSYGGNTFTTTLTRADGTFTVAARNIKSKYSTFFVRVSDPKLKYDTYTTKQFTAPADRTYTITMRATKGSIKGVRRPLLDGRPIENIGFTLSLHLLRENGDGTSTTTLHRIYGYQDAFALGDLQPGVYRAFIVGTEGIPPWMSDTFSLSSNRSVTYFGVCYGSTVRASKPADCATAPTFTISKGAMTNLGDIDFVHHEGFLSGEATSATGVPLTTGSVTLYAADTGTTAGSTRIHEGHWSFSQRLDQPDGTFKVRLTGTSAWYGGTDLASATPVTLADDTVVRDIDLVAP